MGKSEEKYQSYWLPTTKQMARHNIPWNAIFEAYGLHSHNFAAQPYVLTAEQIKAVTTQFKETSHREPRIFCKQDSRDERPLVFEERNLFILPVKNGIYTIVQGEGYIDIPPIQTGDVELYPSKLDFPLIAAGVGDSEMQHLDYAYAASLLRHFMNDSSLVLAIRGRKYTPSFTMNVNGHAITVEGVQTEIDAGYEGRDQIVLVEAKNSQSTNVIIRQLYYPFRQWSEHIQTSGTTKRVKNLFFEKQGDLFCLWEFQFGDVMDYNSIELTRSQRYRIVTENLWP